MGLCCGTPCCEARRLTSHCVFNPGLFLVLEACHHAERRALYSGGLQDFVSKIML